MAHVDGLRVQKRVVLYDNTLASAGVWDVQNIPQNYDHLEILLLGRSSGTDNNVLMPFNNDTTAINYRYALYTQVSVSGVYKGDNYLIGNVAPSTAPANSAGVLRILIPFYVGTTFNKLAQNTGGARPSAEATASMMTMEWESNAAINRIGMLLGSSNTFVAGSRLQIIGIVGEMEQ